MYNNEYYSRSLRELIVKGYDELIKERIIDGWKPHFINFMFNHIHGGTQVKMDTMTSQVDRVHHLLTRHVVKYVKSQAWRHLRPIFFGCHDLPVPKSKKVAVKDFHINGGLHYNVVALVPPERLASVGLKEQYALFGKQSCLTVPLERYFDENSHMFRTDVLCRIHVEPITYGTMADYFLKNYKIGKIPHDAISVWN